MAIEVRVPTILRTYTDGAKAVETKGGTLAEALDALDSDHAGLKDRIVEDGQVRKFINVYVNDEDVRFSGGMDTALSDGDTIVILPAVAGGA